MDEVGSVRELHDHLGCAHLGTMGLVVFITWTMTRPVEIAISRVTFSFMLALYQ